MASQSDSDSESETEISYKQQDIDKFIILIQTEFKTNDIRYIGQSYNRVSFSGPDNIFYDVYPDVTNASTLLVHYLFKSEKLKDMLSFFLLKIKDNVLIVSSIKIVSNPPHFKTQEEFKTGFSKLLNFLKIIHNEFGLTHGDFTSSNILWKDNNPYITDFERSKCFLGIEGVKPKKRLSNCVNVETFKYFKMIDYADLLIVINRKDIYDPKKEDSLKQKIETIQQDADNIKELDTKIENGHLTTEDKIILNSCFEKIKNFFGDVLGDQYDLN